MTCKNCAAGLDKGYLGTGSGIPWHLVGEQLYRCASCTCQPSGKAGNNPKCPTHGKPSISAAGLQRFGIEWTGPTTPIGVPQADGYWTPWHVAEAKISEARNVNDRLWKYARHTDSCALFDGWIQASSDGYYHTGKVCTCGFDQVICL